MKRSGVTLIELLVACVILGFVGAGFMQLSSSVNKANGFSTTMPNVQEDAIRVVNLIAADVRRAPLCSASSGCVTDAALHTGTANSLTVYTTSAGAQRTFSLNSGSFQAVNGSSSTAATTIPDVNSLSFSYCVNSGLSYNMTSSPDSATWVSSVSGSDLKGLIAVRVTATVSRGGLTGNYSTVVRLRNSPKKTNSM